MTVPMSVIYCGRIAHLRESPFRRQKALEIIETGALLVSNIGRVLALGERRDLIGVHPEAARVDFGDAWLIPGLVDGHIHFPQYYATAAHGRQLMDWLERSIFPAEVAYADAEFAQQAATDFIHQLLGCGTTTAMAFGSQFLYASLALFDAAKLAGIRLISGMTLMDRSGPDALLQSPEQARDGVQRLIERCRDEALLHYAITPRFALSCSPAMLEACGSLLKRHPECYVQTHINESLAEVEAVSRDFPGTQHYLEVYDRFGLVGERTLLAHDIHVTELELLRMAEAGCAVCHCPSSNLYLGSGLFPLARHVEFGVPVAIGTDIGAGTHFSVWEELSEAYKIQQLQGMTLGAAELLYLATLGGAEALRLADEVGNFRPGKSADFVVIEVDGYLKKRLQYCSSLEDQLFCLLHLATAAQVHATYVAGRRVWPYSNHGITNQ